MKWYKLITTSSTVIAIYLFPQPSMAEADSLALLKLVNIQRALPAACNGLPALSANKRLTQLAQRHSQYLSSRKRLSHRGQHGDTLGQRASSTGYQWHHIAENLAHTELGPINVIKLWMQSRPHRKNLCNHRYTEFGAANTNGYWTAVFAKPHE